MADRAEVRQSRRALGAQLAHARKAAGLTQHGLASKIDGYGRSTVANAETGHQTAHRDFWLRCDAALAADGALIKAYDNIRALTQATDLDAIELAREAAFRTGGYGAGDRAAQATVEGVADAEPSAVWLPLGAQPFEPMANVVVLRVQIDGREVTVPLNRRLLMQAGISAVVQGIAAGQKLDVVDEVTERLSRVERVTVSSPAHLDEILGHLREQWYALVKTDNLLGPRFALAGVLNQIGIVEALLPALRDRIRLDAVSLGAQYAESAAWLYEDSGNMPLAHYWTGKAMEWAHEADDQRMLAWTIFRRSQQVTATRDAPRAIALAQAARRDEERLATPTRAAIRVQEAYGYALDGDELTAQKLIDDAHTWAASDTVGDARGGHGSYCTASYIEIQRANCWLASDNPKKAIGLYEDSLRRLPPVYQRNHAAALSWLAAAYLADGQLEQAASTAHAALPVARSSGSRRTFADVNAIGVRLMAHRSLPEVAALLDDLAGEGG